MLPCPSLLPPRPRWQGNFAQAWSWEGDGSWALLSESHDHSPSMVWWGEQTLELSGRFGPFVARMTESTLGCRVSGEGGEVWSGQKGSNHLPSLLWSCETQKSNQLRLSETW